MNQKPIVLFTSNVFTPQEIGDNVSVEGELRTSIKNLWNQLDKVASIEVYDGRFPKKDEIQTLVEKLDPLVLGCHLSHPISAKLLENSSLFVVSTATAGYNHIKLPTKNDVLITHTPGVLHEAVADYTIALIMSNLRNIVGLHDYVWTGNWKPSDKWDMDQKLSRSLRGQVLGIVGLGEIGSEVAKKLQNFGVKIVYYDIQRRKELERHLPSLNFISSLRELFSTCDIVSLHVPLNDETENLVDGELLKRMKPNSLLVNTARGNVLNLNDFLDLLERREIFVNFAFDVYPQEPINRETLKRIKTIKASQPAIRMELMPHNASADANTRAKMVIMFLKDIVTLIQSKNLRDIYDVHVIPEQKVRLGEENWRIEKYWRQD